MYSPQETQGFPHKEGLPQDQHKSHLKRGAKTMNTIDSSRERTSQQTQGLPQERGYHKTQELPQERGLHHKHKSFTMNTRINPRRVSPT